MEQLERTVVQLWEARRLAAWGDVPHGRLALLLLDNAAEMSLVRTAQVSLSHADMYSGMAYLLRDVDPTDGEGWKLKQTIESETVSKKQKKQVERNFDALVDYVFGTKDFALSADFAECLKILPPLPQRGLPSGHGESGRARAGGADPVFPVLSPAQE